MKQLYSFMILTLLASLPLTGRADNQPGYLSAIGISGSEVSRQEREVELRMLLDLGQLKLHTQHTLALTPVLVSADGSRETAFPPVVIDGKTRNRVYLRAQRLESVALPPRHDGTAQVIIRRRNGTEQTYDYRATVPYERWMLDSRIELREQVHGCADCAEAASEPQLLKKGVLAPFVPHYRLDRLVPAPEPVKRRAEMRVARLQFRQASYRIEPAFRNNRAELDTVTHSIEVVKTDPDLTITGIYITGYASPEGSMTYNRRLSQNRADALAAYARKDTRVDASLWHVTGQGEDWAGLLEEVKRHPTLPRKDEVIAIISSCEGDQDACERRLKALKPSTIYRQLLEEIYVPLRRNEYRIEYNVRNFDLEEAKRQIHIRPDLLSLAEMYAVACAYEEGSEERCEAMRIAARTYPDRIEAVVNAASAEMEQGNLPAAIRLLESSPMADSPQVLNALGVALARQGQYDRARQVLERAEAAGSQEATHNLQQVAGVVADL